MARDGSSGGVVRLAVIDSNGVERMMVPGNKLPYNWNDKMMIWTFIYFFTVVSRYIFSILRQYRNKRMHT